MLLKWSLLHGPFFSLTTLIGSEWICVKFHHWGLDPLDQVGLSLTLPAGSKWVPLVCKRTRFLPLRDMVVRYPVCYRYMRCPLSSKPTWLAGKSTVEYCTPQKSNIGTKNGHILKESTFSKPSFWVSMLVFGDVDVFLLNVLVSGAFDSRPQNVFVCPVRWPHVVEDLAVKNGPQLWDNKMPSKNVWN